MDSAVWSLRGNWDSESRDTSLRSMAFRHARRDRAIRVRPICLLRLWLLRFLDPTFPGNSLWTWEFHPLTLRLCFSHNPPRSRILVRRSGEAACCFEGAAATRLRMCIYIYIYCYLFIYVCVYIYIPCISISLSLYLSPSLSLYIYIYNNDTYIYIYNYMYV